ncbi:MAG: hypothetical protein WBM44_18025, partial [Waterburya sp.]
MSKIQNISFLSVVVLFTALNLAACQTKAKEKEVLDSSSPSNMVDVSETKLTPHQIFQPILSTIQKQTKIPISLPSYIPESDHPNLLAILETADSSAYKIMLAFDESCTGGTACRLGSISGNSVEGDFDPNGKEVTLANNITGYFIDGNCGANCSDATLAWIENNIHYQVALKAGKQDTLVKMANSAIANPVKDINNTTGSSPTQKEAFTISASGIGVAKLGMTFGELKQKLSQDTEYKIKSPFMVDLDAVAVIQSGEVQYYILYLADSNFTDNSPLEILMTDNPSYLTKEGVGVGTKIKQAETIYGNAKLYYNTFNESREYIRFDNQPAPNVYFRPTFSDSGFAGIYSSSNAE